jgi:serine/threonine-protein kinase
MARRRDVPPEPPDVPPEDMPTQPIDPADPYVRDPRLGETYREEVYEEPPPLEEPPSWWRENLWVWLLVLLILVLGAIGLIWFLQSDDGGGDRAIVPAVVGKTEAEAIRELERAGLKPVVNADESPRPRGMVFAQAPGGGSRLKEGEPVVISVSTGPPTTTTVTTTATQTTTVAPPPPPAPVVVPDVVGQDQVAAGETLESEGLVADSYPVPSEEPAGTVVSQRPAPGTELKEADTVRLNVSLGPDERETSEIPDVTGLEASEARNRARIEGFTVRTVYRDAPSEEEVGEVLTQSPAAGATAPILTQLTLFVGR